jgi:phosphoribosylamine--glycine ligase
VKILVLGSGGREHALVWRLRRDPDVGEVVAAPGNPGMASLGRCLPVDLDDPNAALTLATSEGVDLTVVGPEGALDRGVADVFREAGRPIVGPDRRGAALESSKAFSKDFMARHGVPTARFRVESDPAPALAAVSGEEFGFPVVIKADGLAAGKGVVIAEDRAEAEAAIRASMVDRRFGDAGARVVIEECLSGPEVSFFVLSDGDRAIPLATAQDHKRIWDDDRGPNTGGMGAFAPSPLMPRAAVEAAMREVVEPVLAGMRADAAPYRGFLYVSLMLTPAGPKVIEFNVRFGDPEAQVVLPRLEGRFAHALLASATGTLDTHALTESAGCAVGVVLASAGYPASSDPGRVITGIEAAEADPAVIVFHAGTRRDGGQVVTAGGRVLTVVAQGDTYEAAMASAYAAASRIQFEGMQFRRDIGRKAIA